MAKSIASPSPHSQAGVPRNSPPALASALAALQRATGFRTRSHTLLFFLTTGVFAIFSALQTRTLPEGNKLKPNPPGGPFWFREGAALYWAMKAHLWSVIPAGVLLPLQFLPVVRRRWMGFHRSSGRALLILLLVGNASSRRLHCLHRRPDSVHAAALRMARHSFGGTITTQVWIVTVAGMTTFSLCKAWSSARNLHIDQHRVWILRTWSYACTILSLRIAMIVLAIAVAKLAPSSFQGILPCAEIRHMYSFVTDPSQVSSLFLRYPACVGDSDASVIVSARLGKERFPEEKAALMNMVFGVSGWIALVLHIVLVEAYLQGSQEEDRRLKMVSRGRRRAVGLEEVKEE